MSGVKQKSGTTRDLQMQVLSYLNTASGDVIDYGEEPVQVLSVRLADAEDSIRSALRVLKQLRKADADGR